MSLQLSLIAKWFFMTKNLIKKEDYREITPYWCNRLLLLDGEVMSKKWWTLYLSNYLSSELIDSFRKNNISFKQFDCNIMTLGYPKSSDSERIIKFEHAGIEIRTGNPEWGAEPNKLYFVIKHGDNLHV